MDLSQLEQEHEAIRKTIAALRPYLDLPIAPDVEELANVRWSLASALLQHLASEDKLLYAPLSVHADTCAREAAVSARAELQRFFDAYAGFAKAWGSEQINYGWDDYRGQSRAYLERIEERLCCEETSLFPIARQLEILPDVASGVDWVREATAIKERIVAGRQATIAQ